MAKRLLAFDTATTPKKAKQQLPLSPGEIVSPDPHATIHALVTSVSPVKPSRYFDGELTDGETIIRMVGFDKKQRDKLQSYCDQALPVTIKDCQVQQNKFKNRLEVVLRRSTHFQQANVQFNIPDLKTLGSMTINLNDLPNYDDYDYVTVSVLVVKLHEPKKVGTGQLKQEVLLADATAKAMLTLWEDDINSIVEGKSYQMNKLYVRSFLGNKQLSLARSGSSIDEIDGIEITVDIADSDEDDEEHELKQVTITGFQDFQSLYTCIQCKRAMDVHESNIAVCSLCKTTQRLTNAKLTAKLFVKAESDKQISLRAYDATIRAITDNPVGKITSESLLFAAAFDVTYNKYNVIMAVSRK